MRTTFPKIFTFPERFYVSMTLGFNLRHHASLLLPWGTHDGTVA